VAITRHDGAVTDTERTTHHDPVAPAEPTAAAAPATPGRPTLIRRLRSLDRGLVIASLVLAAGLFLVIRGLAVGVTGNERTDYPDQIESVDPVPEAVQVLSQTSVFVDLVSGQTGVLVIDGIEIPTVDINTIASKPGEQVDLPPATIFEPGNWTLTFTPSSAALVDRFTSGQHTAQVLFWPITEGRVRARSFSWTFNVV
jgi:hypothetical protein